MALAPSTDQFPTISAPPTVPVHGRRRAELEPWTPYTLATHTARRLPWALVGNAAAAVVVLVVLALVIPRFGDALAVAAVIAVLAAAGLVVWKAANR